MKPSTDPVTMGRKQHPQEHIHYPAPIQRQQRKQIIAALHKAAHTEHGIFASQQQQGQAAQRADCRTQEFLPWQKRAGVHLNPLSGNRQPGNRNAAQADCGIVAQLVKSRSEHRSKNPPQRYQQEQQAI